MYKLGMYAFPTPIRTHRINNDDFNNGSRSLDLSDKDRQ